MSIKFSQKKYIFLGALVLMALVVIIGANIISTSGKAINIRTNKTTYSNGETLIVIIKNNSKGSICFSSCYPYFLEKKSTDWKSYPYGECQKKDIIEKCILSTDSKAFEIKLSRAKKGLHRIAVPICTRCKTGDEFKESKRFYSNEFTIKQSISRK